MKEANDSFFHRAIYRKAMKLLRASFFSLMLVNLIKKNILNFLIAILAYKQGALQKKHLTASLKEHSK